MVKLEKIMNSKNIKASSTFPGDRFTRSFRVVLRDNPLCPGKEVVTYIECLTNGGRHVSFNWGHYFNVMNPDGFVPALADYEARCNWYGLKYIDAEELLNDSPDETRGEGEARTAAEDYNFLRALADAN